MSEAELINMAVGFGGFLIGMFGGKTIPLFRMLAKQTPTKLDDAAVDLLQKAVDAEASKNK